MSHNQKQEEIAGKAAALLAIGLIALLFLGGGGSATTSKLAAFGLGGGMAFGIIIISTLPLLSYWFGKNRYRKWASEQQQK